MFTSPHGQYLAEAVNAPDGFVRNEEPLAAVIDQHRPEQRYDLNNNALQLSKGI
jgi:hypothetical protein